MDTPARSSSLGLSSIDWKGFLGSLPAVQPTSILPRLRTYPSTDSTVNCIHTWGAALAKTFKSVHDVARRRAPGTWHGDRMMLSKRFCRELRHHLGCRYCQSV
jgi:hypothetical protein